ncbi:unnamed protein product [Nippostrongylus brasiliensis]|uniref:BPTI/Kunitz inhibitor domain-containing protein n=1 Tax=Nippostrongylus brasiliensis TaxID=27835 RepID=A0A0N4XCG9_NIPBR|nr:unnamed protein product [Nippostrongylus brasiliensis]
MVFLTGGTFFETRCICGCICCVTLRPFLYTISFFRSYKFRYHLDVETLTCLPFKFTGCGGNSNNFPSSSECHFKLDYLNCPANRPAVKRADGSSYCDDVVKCPEGSSCRRGFVVGLCCDNKDIGRGICTPVKHTVSFKNFQTVLIGKSCDHHFCPDGAECHRGPFFAYCCQ